MFHVEDILREIVAYAGPRSSMSLSYTCKQLYNNLCIDVQKNLGFITALYMDDMVQCASKAIGVTTSPHGYLYSSCPIGTTITSALQCIESGVVSFITTWASSPEVEREASRMELWNDLPSYKTPDICVVMDCLLQCRHPGCNGNSCRLCLAHNGYFVCKQMLYSNTVSDEAKLYLLRNTWICDLPENRSWIMHGCLAASIKVLEVALPLCLRGQTVAFDSRWAHMALTYLNMDHHAESVMAFCNKESL
jgi:hypothetical protein